MNEELNIEEVVDKRKLKKNKCLNKIKWIILSIVLLGIVLCIICCNKIVVEHAQEPIENIYIGKVEFTKECKKEIKEIQSELADVYKIKNALISNKILCDIEKYVDNEDANVFTLDNEIRVEYYTEDEKIPYLTKEQQENPKKAFKEELEKVLKLLHAEDKYDVDDFETEFTYGENAKDYNEVTFSYTAIVNSEYGYIGHPANLFISFGKDNNLRYLSYTNYDMNKLVRKYKFKTATEILVDIKMNRNVFVELVGSPLPGKDEGDVIIDSVEVVYEYPQYVDEYKYIVPYYILKGQNQKGDDVRFTMPAIKNRYLWVKN